MIAPVLKISGFRSWVFGKGRVCWRRMERERDDRTKHIALGVSLLMGLALVVPGILLGWRFLPGLLGEWIGTMIGVAMTPFVLETSFAILGLIIVLALNTWRRHKDGDEFVYLEQVAGPEVPANLPEQAKWAIYKEKPLEVAMPSLLAQAEGAFAIGDFQTASEFLGAMDRQELDQPETRYLRVELAKATGREELARKLQDG